MTADARKKEAVKKLPDEDAERQMYWLTKKLLHEAGYERYEISNYAKEGYECRHNLGYWDRVPYLGFGIGALSLVPGERKSRYANPSDVNEYREHFADKFCGELLTVNEEMEEFMFLGLRKIEGVSSKAFYREFGTDIEEIYGNILRKMLNDGLMEQRGRLVFFDRKRNRYQQLCNE